MNCLVAGGALKEGHHDTAKVLQEVKQMRCKEQYERRQQREVTMAEASSPRAGCVPPRLC